MNGYYFKYNVGWIKGEAPNDGTCKCNTKSMFCPDHGPWWIEDKSTIRWLLGGYYHGYYIWK